MTLRTQTLREEFLKEKGKECSMPNNIADWWIAKIDELMPLVEGKGEKCCDAGCHGEDCPVHGHQKEELVNINKILPKCTCANFAREGKHLNDCPYHSNEVSERADRVDEGLKRRFAHPLEEGWEGKK